MDNIPYTCYECNAEFFVFTVREEENEPISYCPYCGAETDLEFDLEDLEDDK